MRYRVYERSLLHSFKSAVDSGSVFETDNLADALAFCDLWADDLAFVIGDCETGRLADWYEFEEEEPRKTA